MDTLGLGPMMKVLDQIGLTETGFCYRNNSKINLDLTSILANVKKYLNMDHFFTTGVYPDTKNETVNRIFVTRPTNSFIFPK